MEVISLFCTIVLQSLRIKALWSGVETGNISKTQRKSSIFEKILFAEIGEVK